MSRSFFCAAIGLVVIVAGLFAQEGIRRGTIKQIDAEKGTITITADGKEHDFALNEETRILGATGKDLKERLKGIKEGSTVQFKAGRQGGKDTLVGLKLADSERKAQPPATGTSKLVPLDRLGKGDYQGFSGGFYPDGKNERPAAHEAAGVALAKQVQPLDADGKPSPDGKVVLLSVGMSNTTQEFSTFKPMADRSKEKNPRLVIVDGAQGGMTAARIQDPTSAGGEKYWATVDQRLKSAGVTRAQVQVAWVKQADAGPQSGFPRYAQTLQAELARIMQLVHERFPNLKLVYLSSRTYGGYASTPLNPEPYAYESGFSVKWLIEQQLKGDPALNYDASKGPVKAPWLSWGPYIWANGTHPGTNGLSYTVSDFGGDGTHPSDSGRRKVAELLLQFFMTDATARPWFVVH